MALTPEQIADSVVPLDLQLSPDGKRVTYSLVPISRASGRSIVNLWIAGTSADNPPRQLTSGESENRFPRWSPDGSQIAFLSDRSTAGVRLLHLTAADGGEVRQLGAPHGESVQSFAWSHDGTSMVFTSAEREPESGDVFPFGACWPFARLRLLAIRSRSVTTLVAGRRHIAQFAISPDGTEVAYHSRQTPAANSEDQETTIERIAFAGTEPRLVCRYPKAILSLTWSRDGRFLMFIAPVKDMTPSSYAVFRVSASGGRPQQLAFGESNCALSVDCPPGVTEAIALGGEGLETRLWWIDLENGASRAWCCAGSQERGDIIEAVVRGRADGGVGVALVRSTGGEPWEIWAGEAGSRVESPAIQRVTSHNDALAGIDYGSQEPFAWTSRDGLRLEGVLIRPPGSAKARPRPMIVLAHGGPYDRWCLGSHLGSLDWGQWLACAGYSVLMPNPRGSFGRGQSFAAAVSGCPGGPDYLDVIEAIDAAVERGIADPERLGIGGWSYGGFMAAWAVTQTRRFKAAVVGAGITDWGAMVMSSDRPIDDRQLCGRTPWDDPPSVMPRDPIHFARQIVTPVLLLHGERDTRVPPGQAIGFYRALNDCDVPSELVIYPRESHFIRERAHSIDVLKRVRSWYDRWLLDSESKQDSRGAGGT